MITFIFCWFTLTAMKLGVEVRNPRDMLLLSITADVIVVALITSAMKGK
jgi:hypothetical protein